MRRQARIEIFRSALPCDGPRAIALSFVHKSEKRRVLEKHRFPVRMDTGWKPILLYAVACHDGSAEMVPA